GNIGWVVIRTTSCPGSGSVGSGGASGVGSVVPGMATEVVERGSFVVLVGTVVAEVEPTGGSLAVGPSLPHAVTPTITSPAIRSEHAVDLMPVETFPHVHEFRSGNIHHRARSSSWSR